MRWQYQHLFRIATLSMHIAPCRLILSLPSPFLSPPPLLPLTSPLCLFLSPSSSPSPLHFPIPYLFPSLSLLLSPLPLSSPFPPLSLLLQPPPVFIFKVYMHTLGSEYGPKQATNTYTVTLYFIEIYNREGYLYMHTTCLHLHACNKHKMT